MNIAIWIAIAIPLLLAGSGIVRGDHRVDEAKLARHERAMGLPLPRTLWTAVLDRISRRDRTRMRFGIGGLVVGTVLGIAAQLAASNDTIGGPIAWIGAIAGLSLGSYLAVRRPVEPAPGLQSLGTAGILIGLAAVAVALVASAPLIGSLVGHGDRNPSRRLWAGRAFETVA